VATVRVVPARRDHAGARGSRRRGAARRIGEIGAGATTSEIAPDLRAGSLKRTNNPLDVALRAPNQFFTVRAPQGDRLTRAGSFALAADGALTDTAGFPGRRRRRPPVRVDPAAAAEAASRSTGRGNLVVGGRPGSPAGGGRTRSRRPS
jgi:flagellar basal body rod protein FlgG